MVNVYSKLPKLQYVHHIVVGYWERKKRKWKEGMTSERQTVKTKLTFHVLLEMW